MKKEQIIDKYSATIKDGFDSAFARRVLNGRKALEADVYPRTYPYTDLIKMYSAGVLAGIDICIKDQEEQ